ncbi:hypothetical protein Gohar_002094, partial [Gossypium harknessii]|nr:hypothetical protein [Gossypium harknessii]
MDLLHWQSNSSISSLLSGYSLDIWDPCFLHLHQCLCYPGLHLQDQSHQWLIILFLC